MTRILLADDHPMIASALDMLLRGTDYEIVGRARNGGEALDLVERDKPDILLLDVNMPVKSGIDALRKLRRDRNNSKVVLLTAGMDDPQLMAAVELEPNGMVLKTSDPALILECMDAVRSGQRWVDPEITDRIHAIRARAHGPSLTARERELVELVSKGMRNRDIAAELGVTEGTVKVYLHGIFDKFGVENRTELAMRAPDLLTR